MALRVVGLGDRELFRDEAASWLEASYPLGELLRHASGEPYPPLYALFLHVWIGAFGDGEAALRWLSVLPGVAIVLVGWRWAHEALGRWGGLVALALIAFSPLALENARDARMYAWEAAFAALAWWMVWRLVSGRAGISRSALSIHAAVLAVACAGELWTLALGVVPAGLQGLVATGALVGRRMPASAGHSMDPRGRRGALSALVGLAIGWVSFLPWVPDAVATATSGQPYWTPTPGWFDWVLTLQVQLVGWRGDPISNLAVTPLLLLGLGGVVWLLRRGAPERRALGWCVLGGVGSILVVWSVSLVRSVYDHRYLGAAGVPLVLGIAAGAVTLGALLTRPRDATGARHLRTAVPLVAVVSVALLSTPFALDWLDTWRRARDIAPVRELVAAVAPRLRPGDALLAFDARAYFSLAYEVSRPERMDIAQVSILDWDSGHEPGYRGGGLIDEPAVIDAATIRREGVRAAFRLGADGRLWLIAQGTDAGAPLAFAPAEDGSLRIVETIVLGAERHEAAQAVLLEVP